MASEKRSGSFLFNDVTVDGVATFRGNLIPASANSGSDVTPNTNVEATFSRARQVRHTRLTLSSFAIAVTDANDFGGTKLVDLPDSNLIILGAEADLVFTKDGTGFITTTDLDASIGTATATATDLTATAAESNVINKVDMNADALAVDMEAHSNDNSATILGVADGASNALYLNVAGTTETSEDGSVLVSGTVDLYWIDTGNVAS